MATINTAQLNTPTLLDLIDIVDNVPLGFPLDDENYIPLFIAQDSRPHGFILRSIAAVLPWTSSFNITAGSVHLIASSANEASEAFQQVIDASRNLKALGTSIAQPGEHFLLPGQPFTGQVVAIERSASGIFGIATRGSHMTAYVRGSSGQPDDILIWVARRASHRGTYPGKLDSTVGGGVKSSHTPFECILAESEEEASLHRSLVKPRIKHTGVVTLATRYPSTGSFCGEILYTYDLELTPDEKPEPGDDDEVDEFMLLPWREVLSRMQNLEFKPNVCAVMIDFFFRHGLITPDDEPEYVEICTRLRRRLPMATIAIRD